MASFIHLFVGITFLLTLISLTNINSLPTNDSAILVIPNVENTVVIKQDACFGDADCNGHGKCINNTVCHCDRGWTTDGRLTDERRFCSYQQRSKQTAFFLSFFAGILGADWFYLSRKSLAYIIAGILKLLIGCGCCGGWPLAYFGPEIKNLETVKSKLRGVNTFFSLLAFTWWIVDWARILANKVDDGNGVKLIPW